MSGNDVDRKEKYEEALSMYEQGESIGTMYVCIIHTNNNYIFIR